jgi:hypothetical protein
LASAAIRVTVSGEDILLLAKWRLTRVRDEIQATQRVVSVASRSNEVKMRRKEN